MNSHRVHNCNSTKLTQRGFTLLEVLLVGGLIVVLTALVSPYTLSLYHAYQLREAKLELTAALRQAQLSAYFAYHDTSIGVRIQNDQFVVFEGEDYATRNSNMDETFSLHGATPSGISEVVFARVTGAPSTTGVIVVTHFTNSERIRIHDSGLIEPL